MEKIVIIGANEFQNPLILKAKKLGYETHVFAWKDGSIGEKTADYFYPISIIEKEEILKKCKENGVNTAMETAADVPWQVFEKVLPYLDFVFCDLKCMDGELHKRLTGVCNTRILENAGRLKTSGVKMRFRMPVVPGLNDGEAEKAARFAGETPIELMAYHVTGCGKYAALGREYTISEIEPPTKEFMAALAKKTGAIYDATGIN